MAIPEFVLTEMYIRRRNRWTLKLQEIHGKGAEPDNDAQMDLLHREFDSFYREFLDHPGTSEASSVNAVLAMMHMKGMTLPLDWIDPRGLESTTADTPLIEGCRAWNRREETIVTVKEALQKGR